MWRGLEEPIFTETVEIDLSDVEPCLAGPFRPNQRTPLGQVPKSYHDAMADMGRTEKAVSVEGAEEELRGRRRCARGDYQLHKHLEPGGYAGRRSFGAECGSPRFTQKPWVKTSLSPGSAVVADYLSESRPAGRSRCARLSRHRVWLHELRRAFRPVA